MPHADHALTHAAPAFPGAGSCLERTQHHIAMPLAPRQVSELCTFRLTPTHWRRQAINARESASGPHVTRKLCGLTQRGHSTAWLNMSPALRASQRVGWPPRSTTWGMARWLTGDSAEFPCLASRVAGHTCLGRPHRASRLAHMWQGRSIPGHLRDALSPRLCTVRHSYTEEGTPMEAPLIVQAQSSRATRSASPRGYDM